MKALGLAAALLALAGPRAAAAPGSVAFAVDPRVELFSVVLRLSGPGGFGPGAYAAAAGRAFSPLAGHRAVALVAASRAKGAAVPELLREALAPEGALPDALKEFEKASDFGAFFAGRREDRLAFEAEARREALHAQSPRDALAYMGLPFEGARVFILAPLLPDEPGLAALGVRGGTPSGGGLAFGFDGFESSPAAVLSREAVDWLRPPAGDLPAHIAAAVGLRLIARDLGERVYRRALVRLANGRLPRLEAVSERLKDYERGRRTTLKAFSPRLEGLADLRLEQAAQAARGGARAEALALLREARAQSPVLETARRVMFLYQDLGEDAEAKAVSDEILRSAPRHPGALLDRAALAAKAGDRGAALGFLSRAALQPSGEDARRRMAALATELKDYEAARVLLDALIAGAPADARLRVDRAIVAARAGDRETGLRLLAEAAALAPPADERRRMSFAYLELDDRPAARRLLDALIQEAPADASLKAERADVAAADGDRAAALRLLDEARALSPDAASRRRIALLYQELDEDERGAGLMAELLAASPKDARLRLDRAARAARAGDRETALAFLAEARRLNPTFEERRLMASLHQGLGDYGPALSLLSGLIGAAPKDAGLRVDRAALALQAGDAAAARRDLASAAALKPDAADRRRMALLRQDLKDYAAALELLEPLARERPADAALLADLGLCRYLAGRAGGAIESLRAAIALDPGSLPAIVTLGAIYGAQRRFDEERAVYAAAPAAGGSSELRAALERGRREALARTR